MSPRGRNDLLHISVDLLGAVQWMMMLSMMDRSLWSGSATDGLSGSVPTTQAAFFTTLPAASFFLKLPPSTLLHVGGQHRLVDRSVAASCRR